MTGQDDFGMRPAFPTTAENGEVVISASFGMMLRQYAAIRLRVPDSGTDWLDDMIRESLRNDFRLHALTGLIDGYAREIAEATGTPRAGFDEFVANDSEQRHSNAVADDADEIAAKMMQLVVEDRS